MPDLEGRPSWEAWLIWGMLLLAAMGTVAGALWMLWSTVEGRPRPPRGGLRLAGGRDTRTAEREAAPAAAEG